jgi:hypothetical protein
VSSTVPGALYKIPFVIGVAGHRDLVTEELPAIRTAVEQLLRVLRDAHSDVRLQLLCSMAEGADLLVAEIAGGLGIDVVALLPFSQAQCRADLTTDTAREVFDRALVRAERLELPAPEGVSVDDLSHDKVARDRQFERAGMLVARYCSLLIALWDGVPTEHSAGTARVVDFRRSGMLGRPDADIDLLLSAEDNDLTYEIRCSRRATREARDDERGVHVLGFVSGGRNHGSIEQGVPAALGTLLERTADFNRDVDQYGRQIAAKGRRLAPASPYDTPESLVYVDRLFMGADWLGTHFQRCFTRALILRYALWAVLAFLLLAFKKEHGGLLGLGTIVGVLIVFGLGWLLALWAHGRSWHRRYLDYRALAEGLRVDFYWELAGVRGQFDGEFAHESFLQKQDVELEWIRAAMRAVNLRCALCPRVAWPSGFAHTFAAWVGDPDPVNGSGQLRYYRLRSRKLHHRQEVAEHIARGMLVAGLSLGVVLAVDAVLQIWASPFLSTAVRSGLLWALALLTVYGAIFEIYLGEKADRSLIRQYRYMDRLFSFAARELRSARSNRQKLRILRSLGHACLAEHAQWILAHRDKRIEGMRW